MARPRTRRALQAPAIRTGQDSVDRALDATRDVVNKVASKPAPGFDAGTFNFQRQPGVRANVDVAALRLFEPRKNVERAVELRSPTRLAAAYSLTMPEALPAATSILQVTAAGELETTRDLDVDSIAVSGDVTVGGSVKRGPRVRKYSALALTGVSAGTYIPITKNVGGDGIVETTSASTAALLPIVIDEGERILSVAALVQGTASNRIEMSLHRTSESGGADTQIGGTVNNTGTAVQSLSISGLSEVVDDLMNAYFVRFGFNTTIGQRVWAIAVTTDVP
jgi:hypothetical protein